MSEDYAGESTYALHHSSQKSVASISGVAPASCARLLRT